MIAGIPFARCDEVRWHGTSATATARKQTLLMISVTHSSCGVLCTVCLAACACPYFYQLNGEILQYMPNTLYFGVKLSTYLKFNIQLNKNVAQSYQCLAFVRRNLT